MKIKLVIEQNEQFTDIHKILCITLNNKNIDFVGIELLLYNYEYSCNTTQDGNLEYIIEYIPNNNLADEIKNIIINNALVVSDLNGSKEKIDSVMKNAMEYISKYNDIEIFIDSDIHGIYCDILKDNSTKYYNLLFDDRQKLIVPKLLQFQIEDNGKVYEFSQEKLDKYNKKYNTKEEEC